MAEKEFCLGINLKKAQANTESAGKPFRAAIQCLEGPQPSMECGVCGYVRERRS